MPLAWVLGVEWYECDKVGKLIGLKTILNEFVAYEELAKMLEAGELSVSTLKWSKLINYGYCIKV